MRLINNDPIIQLKNNGYTITSRCTRPTDFSVTCLHKVYLIPIFSENWYGPAAPLRLTEFV